MSEQMHLWEFDHPYYCSEGCYYVPGGQWADVHSDWTSWAEFLEEWGDVDPDYNLLFRWDWKRADPADYEYERKHETDFEMPGDTLHLFFYLQRKAKPFSHEIQVTEADEASVREWLTGRALHMRKLWEPLLDGEAAA
ncbi:hypothetical protein LJR186_001186 [Microbacterium foliorum]